MSMNNVNSYNVNNYCACTGGTPEYIIKLNQQGPPGPQGEQGLQGPQGVSPEVSVYQDTDDTYILQVITATSSFMTPNLMAQADDLVNNLDQKLSAEIDTKANLTLDNINVANPFTLNGLVIDNSSDEALELRPTALSKDLQLYTGMGINLLGTLISIEEDDNNYKFTVGNTGVKINNEDVATQPWVEEQLEGFISDLPVATTSTLGAVKVQGYPSIDTTTYPQVFIGTNSGNADTYQKLFVDDTLLAGGVISIDTSISGLKARNVKKAYLALNTTAQDVTLQGIGYENINQEYDSLLGTWMTTGHTVRTIPIQATTSRLGFVKPDGTTITITDDGTISAVGGGGGGNIINDDVPSDTTTYSSSKIDQLNGQQNGQITQLVDTVTKLQESVTALRNRVAALEANINGGNA